MCKKINTNGTLQLVGDYGVYSNGLMIQISLPKKASILYDENQKAFTVEFDLNNNLDAEEFYGKEGKREIESRLCKKMRRIIEYFRLGIEIQHIKFITEFPIGVNIEENVVYLLLKGFMQWSDQVELCQKVLSYEYNNTRKNSSYLYLLSPFMEENVPFFIFKRETPRLITWAKFSRENFPPSRAIVRDWLDNTIPLRPKFFDDNEVDSNERKHVDIMIVSRPKSPLRWFNPSIGEAVSEISNNYWFLFENLGRMMERVGNIIATLEGKWDEGLWRELGRLLTAYHFTTNVFGRTDCVSNQLIGELLKNEFFCGGKSVGGGPGGTVILLYMFKPEEREVILKKLVEIVIRYGYCIVCDGIFGDNLVMQKER